jgi:predicted NBD/HSP70 family sugar kinase
MSFDPAKQSLRGRSSVETRSAILDLIRSTGAITRVELSRRAGLTEATISKIVTELMASGLIVTSGQAESTGGKPATFLRLDTSKLGAVGVVLDLPQIAIVLCAIDGSVIGSNTVHATRDDPPEAVLQWVASAVEQLILDHEMTPERIIGLGVALSGRRGYRGTQPLDWWEELPIADQLHSLTGIDVLLENDANCAALNEFWSGGIPAGRDFVVIYAAEGIGAGIVIDGDAYRGSSSHAGEIGHVYVDRNDALCWCGRRGCLEVSGTPQAVAHRALQMPELVASLDLSPRDSARAVFSTVALSAASGNEPAHALISDAAALVSTAIVGLANTLDIDLVILAGPGFAHAGQIYLEIVRSAVDDTYTHSVHQVEVQLRSVDPNIAALGAASLVLHRRLTPHHTT